MRKIFVLTAVTLSLILFAPSTVAAQSAGHSVIKLKALPANVLAFYSFEDGTEGWWPYSAGNLNGIDSTGSIATSESEYLIGSKSLKIYGANGVGDAYAYTIISGLAPGQNYKFSAYALAPAGSVGSAYIKVGGWGADYKSRRIDFNKLQNWKKINLDFTATSTIHEFDLLANSMTSGSTLFFDKVQVSKAD